MGTSNHGHLLLFDRKRHGEIPETIQLAAGGRGPQYNQGKRGEGTFMGRPIPGYCRGARRPNSAGIMSILISIWSGAEL